MSFKPITFTFDPPKTVPIPPSSNDQTKAPSTGINKADSSRANSLIQKLDELIETSNYLQETIVSRNASTGVAVNPNIDPDLQRALTSIYNTDNVPFITVSMFDKLLDADLDAMKLGMSLDGSELEANPVQVADLNLTTKRVEGYFLEDGSFQSNLAVMLRSLKGDAIIFESWKDSLSDYPVMNALDDSDLINNFNPTDINRGILDVSPKTFANDDNYLNRFSQAYAGIYRLLAEVSHIENDINRVINNYFYQPIENVIRLIGLFNALRSFVHKVRLTDIADDLSNFAYIRLGAELGETRYTMDRFIQMAVAPIKNLTGELGQVLGAVQGLGSTIGHISIGGAAGMLSYNSCSNHTQTRPVNSKHKALAENLKIPGIDTLSAGLKSMGEHIDWAQREATRRASFFDENFKKLAERRLNVHADRLELMCSLQALESLINIGKGFANQGSSKAAPVINQNKADTINSVVTNLNENSNTTFTVDDEDILINPPTMPEPNEKVKRVLSRGGIERLINE
jgi:hypothetical protein